MTQVPPSLIYKVCSAREWQAAEAVGTYKGSPVDLKDGFIHFSAAQQLRETVRRYFAGLCDLVLIEVQVEGLGEALRWESSRGGDLFPHLYAVLPFSAAAQIWDLPLGADGLHQFPAQLEQLDA